MDGAYAVLHIVEILDIFDILDQCPQLSPYNVGPLVFIASPMHSNDVVQTMVFSQDSQGISFCIKFLLKNAHFLTVSGPFQERPFSMCSTEW